MASKVDSSNSELLSQLRNISFKVKTGASIAMNQNKILAFSSLVVGYFYAILSGNCLHHFIPLINSINSNAMAALEHPSYVFLLSTDFGLRSEAGKVC